MDEIQKILVQAGRKDLAQKYYLKIAASKTAGRWQPDIDSSQRAFLTLYKKDFRSKRFFEGLKSELGLDDAFHRKMKGYDSGGEPESSVDDYDSITVWVSKSQMS